MLSIARACACEIISATSAGSGSGADTLYMTLDLCVRLPALGAVMTTTAGGMSHQLYWTISAVPNRAFEWESMASQNVDELSLSRRCLTTSLFFDPGTSGVVVFELDDPIENGVRHHINAPSQLIG